MATKRPAGVLGVEDIALAGANLVAVPATAALGAEPPAAGEPALLLGLVELLAVTGVIVALATRPPGRTIFPTPTHYWLFAGPLLGGVSLVGADAAEHLGFGASGILGLLTFVAVVAAFVLSDRLPVLDTPWRRLLVAPFVLLASGWFTRFVGDILDGLDLAELTRALFDSPSVPPEQASVAGIVAFFLVAGSAAFYAMLIVAPRELAAPEPGLRVWFVRYFVFAVSAAVGAWGIVLL